MALVKSEDVAAQFRGLSHLSALRQIAMMAGLAASVALGMWVVMWSQEPSYRVLFSNLNDQDAVQITEELQQLGVEYKLNDQSGSVMVTADRVHDVRLKLASQGLPKGSGVGFELLEKESGFGTSQFIETARYHRALEGELGRTISSLKNVESARVHLAIPEQPSFIRNRRKPSASVMINLFAGRNLEDGQVAAITNLVSSSIPHLEPDRVTVVDEKGQLLTGKDASKNMAMTSSQFEYRRKLEEYYVQRIEDLLSPITGQGNMRAQVSADLDFTEVEQTKESFNPDLPAIRSEQTTEQKTVGSNGTSGVPGSLSNQAPGGGIAQGGQEQPAAGGDNASAPPVNTTRRSTRNYELDRIVSHTKLPSGSVRRLSVAVVIDNKETVNDDGEAVAQPLTQEELDRYTGLVKDAVGFKAQRGDSVSVVNVPFNTPPEPEPLPEPSLFEKPWLWSGLKVMLAGGVILLLMFGVLRPVLRELAAKGKTIPEQQLALQGAQAAGGQQQIPAQQGGGQLSGPSNYEDNLGKAKNMANQDPKVVAQVVRNWVANDA